METGILFALAAALCWGASPVLVKRGLATSDVSTATMLQQGSTLATLILLTGARVEVLTSGISAMAVLVFIVAGFVGAYLGRTWLVQSVAIIGASKAQSLTNASPVVTILLAGLLLGESLTPPVLAGASLVISGVLFITRAEEKRQKTPRGLRTFLIPFLAMVTHGVMPLLKKIATDYGGPAVLGALIIHATGLVLLLAAGNLLEIRFRWRPVPRASAACFMASGVCYALGSIFTLVALRYAPAVIVVPIWNIQPLVSFLLVRATLRGIEVVTPRDGLAAVFVVAGVVVLSWG